MRSYVFCLVAASSALFSGDSIAQQIAMELGEKIAVADLSSPTSAPRPLVAGSDPCISPDGSKVAFTEFDDAGNRRIAIADAATGKSKLVEGIPGDNNYLPIWSPDGAHLYFNHFVGDKWEVARAKADGGGFTILKTPREAGAYGVTPDGRSLICHDLDGFFRLDLSGESPAMAEIPKTQDFIGLAIPSRVALAPDGASVLFDYSVEEEMGPNDEGPPSAVFRLDLATGKVSRITPKGMNASSAAWLPDGKSIVFSAFDIKTEQFAVYQMQLNDASAKPALLFKNAGRPTLVSK